jgi:hypothetical protein
MAKIQCTIVARQIDKAKMLRYKYGKAGKALMQRARSAAKRAGKGMITSNFF